MTPSKPPVLTTALSCGSYERRRRRGRGGTACATLTTTTTTAFAKSGACGGRLSSLWLWALVPLGLRLAAGNDQPSAPIHHELLPPSRRAGGERRWGHGDVPRRLAEHRRAARAQRVAVRSTVAAVPRDTALAAAAGLSTWYTAPAARGRRDARV